MAGCCRTSGSHPANLLPSGRVVCPPKAQVKTEHHHQPRLRHAVLRQMLCCVCRAALASHTRLGQQLSSLLAINRSLNGSGDPESPPDSPSWLTSHFGNPLFAEDRWETTGGGARTPNTCSYTGLAEPAPAFCISPTSKQVVPLPLQVAGEGQEDCTRVIPSCRTCSAIAGVLHAGQLHSSTCCRKECGKRRPASARPAPVSWMPGA